MLPVLDDFVKKHGTEHPTVVADAGMLSYTNVTELTEKKYSYIVGARTGVFLPRY